MAKTAVAPAVLVERRDRLARELAELQWDLGGLVSEMVRRDDFRLDVVGRRAARLQRLDAELADVERLIRLDSAGADGSCPACGALYARGAAFCWQCGRTLNEQRAPAAPNNVAASNGPAPGGTAPGPSSTERSAEQR